MPIVRNFALVNNNYGCRQPFLLIHKKLITMENKTIFEKLDVIEQSIANFGLAQKDVLTFEEVCAYTGLSKSWLYKLTSTKQIPHYKPTGKLCYFDRAELDGWIKRHRVSTNEEIETEAQAFCMQRGGGVR